MGALHRASAHIQRRTDDFVNAQSLGPYRGANNIHHGIHCADFVEVNLLDVGVVNLGLCRAQRFENSNRGRPSLLR